VLSCGLVGLIDDEDHYMCYASFLLLLSAFPLVSSYFIGNYFRHALLTVFMIRYTPFPHIHVLLHILRSGSGFDDEVIVFSCLYFADISVNL
jgi:hypothetical protein